ncbi:MAG: WXG100 family type VII secretion target [Chloroflexi bacterium]|nr:WXG100 family type VII secretion target [Chloroflexota bacterium]MCC6895919.1 WXG100 family type VII secretion target [Anaerolineae bacterium]
MSDTVSIDYQGMQKVSQSFSHEAARVKKVLNDINGQLAILKKGGWLADAANIFYREMDNDICPRISRLHHALEVSAQKSGADIPQTFKNSTDEACNCLPNS